LCAVVFRIVAKAKKFGERRGRKSLYWGRTRDAGTSKIKEQTGGHSGRGIPRTLRRSPGVEARPDKFPGGQSQKKRELGKKAVKGRNKEKNAKDEHARQLTR